MIRSFRGFRKCPICNRIYPHNIEICPQDKELGEMPLMTENERADEVRRMVGSEIMGAVDTLKVSAFPDNVPPEFQDSLDALVDTIREEKAKWQKEMEADFKQYADAYGYVSLVELTQTPEVFGFKLKE